MSNNSSSSESEFIKESCIMSDFKNSERIRKRKVNSKYYYKNSSKSHKKSNSYLNISSSYEEENFKSDDYNDSMNAKRLNIETKSLEVNSSLEDLISYETKSESSLNNSKSTEDSSLDDYSSDENENETHSESIFNNSETTLNEFLVSLLGLQIKHKLSDSAIRDFLVLTKLVLPQPNRCPKTVKGFNKILSNKGLGKYHMCCIECKQIIKSDHFENFKNQNNYCTFCKSKLSSFITFDIKRQLKNILNENNINQMNDSLSYARKEKKGIYNALDGSVYTNFLKNKQVNSKFILSFNLNTDGAPILKSRGYSTVVLSNCCRRRTLSYP